jgi:PAS domain S-box-containing protein
MMGKKSYEELEKYVLKLEKTVSRLRSAEVILKDELTWLNMLLAQSRDGIVILDENGKTYRANKQFANMLGYSTEEISSMHVWDWEFMHTKERTIIMLQSVTCLGEHFETQHRRKDGRIIDVEISTNGGFYKGDKLILCICRDITEFKKTEKKRLQLIKENKELKLKLKQQTSGKTD